MRIVSPFHISHATMPTGCHRLLKDKYYESKDKCDKKYEKSLKLVEKNSIAQIHEIFKDFP